MRYMMSYDFMETVRNTNQWVGATASAAASYPLWGVVPNPAIKMIQAWGEVTERSFARMVTKPDWGIDVLVGADGARPYRDRRKARLRGRSGFDQVQSARSPRPRPPYSSGRTDVGPLCDVCCVRPCTAFCPTPMSGSPTGTTLATFRSAQANSTSKITRCTLPTSSDTLVRPST